MQKIMVALITPFTTDDQIDYAALSHIIERLIEEGCEGFIVCGTTAETPTLTQAEKFAILAFVIEQVKRRVEIWFGCGSNSTIATIEACKKAQVYDITGLLLVVPYYNKPTQEGLYQHFKAVANATYKKIMIYNIPSRTQVEILAPTILRLWNDCENIVALKHASHNLEMIKEIHQHAPSMLMYSGEDGYLDECFDIEMEGLISVMGHVNMKDIKAYIKGYRNDTNLQTSIIATAKATFLETSPGPIKYMLYKRGECENRLRLPLVSVAEKTKLALDLYMTNYNKF